jgi:hypothetical protein
MRKVPRKCDLNLATDAHAWFDESKQNLGIEGYSQPDDETLTNSYLNQKKSEAYCKSISSQQV